MLGKILGVSGSAVSQWEAEKDPTMPDIKYLYAMALEFNTTIEQLVYNDNLTKESVLSTVLNNQALVMLYSYLDKKKSLNYAFVSAPPRMKAYLFATMYGFIDEGLRENQPESEILGYIEQVLKTNESATKKSIIKSQKRTSAH